MRATSHRHDPRAAEAERRDGLNVRAAALAYSMALCLFMTPRAWAVDPMATPVASPRLGAQLYALSVTADGSRIAAAGDAGFGAGLITVWDGGGAERWFVDLPPAVILCAEWAPAGDVLLFGAEDGRAWLYTRDQVPLRIWPASTAPLLACAFTPDGSLALTAGADHVIRAWDVASGELRHEMRGHSGAVFALDVSASGARVASGGADGAALLWTLGSDEPDARWAAHDNTVSAVAFLADDETIATAGWDGRVLAMSEAGGEPAEIDRLSGPVFALDVAPDGVTLAGGASAGEASLTFWNIPSRARALTLAGESARRVRFVPGAFAFSAGMATGETRLWESNPATPAPTIANGFQTTTLRWSDESALYYEVQVGRAQPFREGDATLITRDTLLQLPEAFVDGSTVWWRVRARGFADAAEWSESRSVISGGPITSTPRVWVDAFPAQVAVGDNVTARVRVEGAIDLAGFSADIVIEPAVLAPTAVAEGDALRADGTGTIWNAPVIAVENGGVALSEAFAARLLNAGISANGVLLTVEFEAVAIGEATIRVRDLTLWNADQAPIEADQASASVTVHAATSPADVTEDGLVDVRDLVFVAQFFGLFASDGDAARADVNRSGEVDIVDLLLVAREFGSAETAKVAASPSSGGAASLRRVRERIIRAGPGEVDPAEWRRLLAVMDAAAPGGPLSSTSPALTTAPAYPNPSNPESWIPFALSDRADVTVVIFDTRGSRVRAIALGAREAGVYRGRAEAAHWDGRDDAGDVVAGGLYIARVVASPDAGGPTVTDHVRIVMAR